MKVAVALLNYRPLPPSLWPRFLAAVQYARTKGIDAQLFPFGNALLHVARNAALVKSPDADYVVMIDDDMMLEEDHIYRLVSQDKPVISGLCTTRKHPVKLAVSIWNEERQCFSQVDELRGRSTGQFAPGAAFIAIRRDAIDTLVDRHVKALDWLEDNRRMFDRLHVRAEYREAERQRVSAMREALWAHSRQVRIFEFPVVREEGLGEDIGFGYRLMQARIPVTIDPRITPGHMGEYPYSVWDYEPTGDGTKEPPPPPDVDELVGLLKAS